MKNLDYALEVLAHVHVPIVFTIHGPKEDRAYWCRCESLIRRLPRNVNVIDAGELNPNEVIPSLACHDLLFLPSAGENHGHVIVEALQAGLRVLVSDRTPWRGLSELGVGYDLPLGSLNAFRWAIHLEATRVPSEDDAKRRAEILKSHANVDEGLSAHRALFRL